MGSNALFLKSLSGEGAKGRAFQVSCLAYVIANHLWEGGNGRDGPKRPVWIALAAGPTAMRPVTAAIRMGAKMALGTATDVNQPKAPPYAEFLKSHGYTFLQQAAGPDTVTTTVYLPELFDRDPGQVTDVVQGLVTVPLWWANTNVPADSLVALAARLVKQQKWSQGAYGEDFAFRLATAAPLVLHYLDRRIRAPLPKDPAFQVYLLAALLAAGAIKLARVTEDKWWGGSHHSSDLFGHTTCRSPFPVFRDVFELNASVDAIEKVIVKAVLTLKPEG